MLEKLIENWLTDVNELGYQIPFCEALLAKGYSIIYISSHGPGEHGKDIIARDSDGKLWTFQLKGGDIRLPQWREIRGEVEDLVRLPVSYPGISHTEPHTAVLVTNGRIAGDARESINHYINIWGAAGTFQLWSRGQVLDLFIKAHGRFLHLRRAIESMALIGGYIAQQYAKAGNYVSEAEAWTIVASTILHVAARENLHPESFQASLHLVETAIGPLVSG